MADGRTPYQNILSSLGQNFNTSANAIAEEPGVAAAGALLGVPKGFVDIPTYLGEGAMNVGNFLMGNTRDTSQPSFLEKYEAGWRDAAINLGSLGQNVDENREVKERAAGAPMLISSLASPSLPIPGIKAATKGGAGGIAGEMLAKGAVAQEKALTKAASSGLMDIVIDPLIKGGSQAVKGAGKIKEGVNQIPGLRAATSELLANTMNPKAVTNFIHSADPHILPALSTKYNIPVSKVDDLGQPLYKKFKSMKAEKGPINLDDFINKELADMKIDRKAKVMLKDQLKESIQYNNKFMDVAEAEEYYAAMLGKAKNIKKTEDNIKYLESNYKKMTPAEEADFIYAKNRALDDLAQGHIDNDKLLDAARRVRTNYDNAYNEILFEGDSKLIEKADSIRFDKQTQIIDDLNKIDPLLAREYQKAATQSFVGDMGRVFNWFKAEPYIGDLVQSVEALPHATLNNAEILGISSLDALPYRKNFKGWFKNPEIKKIYQDNIVEKYRNNIQALQEQIEMKSRFDQLKSIKSLKDLQKLKLSDIGNQLMALGDRVGYAFQSGARERIIENVIMPEAYSQIKVWGKYKEGTKEFNKAVMNHTRKYMEDLGMIAPDSKFLTKSTTGSFKVNKHIDDFIQDSLMTANHPLSNEARSAALFMTKWVKGALQAKLQGYNGMVDVFKKYGRTGKLTKADRAKFLNSVVSMTEGIALFGARGAKIPGFFVENPVEDLQPDQIPETVGTWLAGQIADTLKFDNELRNTIREGAWYKLTGMSGARTESIPVIGVSAGSDIATSMITSKLGNLINAAMTAVESEDLSVLNEALVGTFIPKDVDILNEVNVTGEIKDSKGNKLDIEEGKFPFQESVATRAASAITKNLTPDYEVGDTPKFSEADTKIKEKYKKYKLSGVLKEDTFNNLLDDTLSLYTDNPGKAVKVIKTIIEEKAAPHKTKLFNSIGRDANDLLALDASVLEKYKPIQRLTKQEVIDIAAESFLFERNTKKTFNLLVKSGKLNMDDEKIMDKIIDSYLDKQEDLIKEIEKL